MCGPANARSRESVWRHTVGQRGQQGDQWVETLGHDVCGRADGVASERTITYRSRDNYVAHESGDTREPLQCERGRAVAQTGTGGLLPVS